MRRRDIFPQWCHAVRQIHSGVLIEMRRARRSFGDSLIAAEVGDLREPWMAHADAVLADEQLVATVYEALAKRHPKHRGRGRKATPAPQPRWCCAC